MTNYQSTSYHVEDDHAESVAFTVLPAYNSPPPELGEHEPVLKVWSTQELPDGQPINVAVELDLSDVRGLQAFLNDQFGRGVQRLPYSAEDTVRTAIHNLQNQGYKITAPDGTPGVYVEDLQKDREPGWGIAPDGAATWNPLEAQRAAEALGGDQAADQFLDAMQSASEAIAQMQPRTASEWATQNPTEVSAMKQQYAETYGVLADTVTAQPVPVPLRQCPVIYNGVQCTAAAGHDFQHQFTVDWATLQAPQTGDGAATPPATASAVTPGATGGEQAAESAPVVGATEVPSPSLPYIGGDKTLHAAEEQFEQEHPSAPDADKPIQHIAPHLIAEDTPKKKSNRRKKEELAYDKALEAFRAQPQTQLAYTDLVKAAEALRKRFPDNERLEKYDRHVQMQDVGPLLSRPGLAAPEERPAEVATPVANGPHFAPEPAAEQAPAPFVPPVSMPAPEQQSAEEIAAAQAFPCQHRSSDGTRQCTRPAGHELANPPKPHIYAALQPGQALPEIPNFIPPMPAQPVQQPDPGFTSTPVGQPVTDGQGFTQATIPPFQIPQPAPATQGQQVLSFQVPPTPEVQGAELQPPAPAAPPWGGQQ